MGCGPSIVTLEERQIIIEQKNAANRKNQSALNVVPRKVERKLELLGEEDDDEDFDLDDLYEQDDEDEDLDQQWQEQLKNSGVSALHAQANISNEVRKQMAQKFKSDDPFWNAMHILHGNPYVECRSNVKVVRIFTSSTFTDTKVERNLLMEKVYPKLKTFCQKLGYEFQVVDMRWGVRSEAEDDHMTTEYCLKELALCQKLSTGPNFVTFLSHKYGYQPIPRTIPVQELETIISTASQEDKQFISQWYMRDDNAVPAVYVLQPISTHFPDFVSSDIEVYRAAKNQWWATFDKLQCILQKGVDANVSDESRKHEYYMGVTERELLHGIEQAEQTDKHCFWFKRNIVDILQAAEGPRPGSDDAWMIERFYDGRLNPKASELLPVLSNVKLPSKLPAENIKNYDIHWTDHGVDPKFPEHSDYLSQLLTDFQHVMERMIESGIEDRKAEEMDDSLYFEVVQHVNFCRAKAEQFSGRDDLLQHIKHYIKEGAGGLPLILHGQSGCGKTSLLAVVANLAWSWIGETGAVVYRFIGTTQSSSSLSALLRSIVGQLLRIYDRWNRQPTRINIGAWIELKFLIEHFKDLMKRASEKKPLVIILDSLDQLDAVDGGKNLHWLPRLLPPNVKLILSTLPEESHGIMPKLRTLYPLESCYTEVPKMKTSDVDSIINLWLDRAGRRLSEDQRNLLIAAYTLCPLPLFLKLSFDEALRWHSYDSPDVISHRLKASVYHTIDALFERMEKIHGYQLVTNLLGCLTVSQNGLSEGELEDILSLNEDILNDVYQYHVPPVRRLPPLLAVRIRHDLEEYIVNRGVDNVQVIYWYHRQFMETAWVRYLNTEDKRVKYHRVLAEYFMGKWADVAKPYINKKGEEKEAFRYVAKQPLRYSTGGFNKRKLMQLPYHLIFAGDVDLIKSQALCNYRFLLTKLQAISVSAVLYDLKLACSKLPADQELFLLKETLQLSKDGLNANATELAGQLMGRIHGTGSVSMIDEAKEMLEKGTLPPEAVDILNLLEAFEINHQNKIKYLNTMINEAEESISPILCPHRGYLTPPGGQLVHKLAGHTGKVLDLDITSNGKITVTGSQDSTAKLWNMLSGEVIHSIDFPHPVTYVRFCHQDKWLLVSCSNKHFYVVDIDVEMGTIFHQMQGDQSDDDLPEMVMPVEVCTNSNGKEIIVAMRNSYIELWSLEDGQRMASLENCLDDWSVYNKGAYLTYRHLVADGRYYVYCTYRGTEIFIGNVNDVHGEPGRLEVFDPYDFNPDAEESDFTPRKKDHIGALGITGLSKQVIISNGKDQNLYFFDIESGDKLRIIQFKGNARMRAIFFPPGENYFYFCNKASIGVMNVDSKEAQSLLPHSCLAYKVVGIGKRYLATIAEDSMLRIWDRTMEPYIPDVSQFTGKVKVSSQSAANKAMKSFEQMFSNIAGGKTSLATKDLLTTDEIENYWTKEVKTDEFEELVTSKAFTQFHKFKNALYVGVSHSDIDKEMMSGFAFCFTIWETTHMTCVRRLFFPVDTVYVYAVINDEFLLLCENQRLKLLDLKGMSFKVCLIFQGKTCKNHKPTVIYNKFKNEIVTENRSGAHLKVYDGTTGKTKGLLKVSPDVNNNKFLKSVKKGQSCFTQIQMSKNGSVVGAWYCSGVICLWNTESCSALPVVDPRSVKMDLPPVGDKTEYQFRLTQDGSRLVLMRDNLQMMRDAKDTSSQTSTVLINTATGEMLCHATPNNKSGHATMLTLAETIPVVRAFKRKYLQIIGIGIDGKAHYVSEIWTGRLVRQVRANKEGDLLVTWCQRPREKTVRYFSYKNLKLTLLGSFTPDKEVTDVGMIDNGQTLLLDSPGGLIKLELKGKGVAPPDEEPRKKANRIYPGVELDLPFELGNKDDDEKEESDDPDTN